jgi:ABC-type bacteriocin/lantibiotic exporter with double-glycine peptidase domain
VLENISLGNPDLEPEVLVDALQKLGAWESINAIEGGLSAELDGSGHPLSTASLKAIMLSRAMIHRPSTLILDGFMESFEVEKAQRILEVLSAPEYSWTLIVGTTDSQIAALAKTRRSL